MSQALPLPHGLFAIVDDEDFERCSQFRWYLNSHGYVMREIRRSGARTIQYLSRFVMNAPVGVLVDHKEGDLLDNRKSQLRFCTKSQNMCNRGKNKNNTSGHKGVTWDKSRSKWRAQIEVNGKGISLGYFTDVTSASASYAEASLRYHGEFSRTKTLVCKVNTP